jgi:enoyl-CoA hydratase/carnithine racemase
MCSLRLPIWIGRNKVLDYMFLNKGFSGRQAFARASKVVPDDQVDEIGLAIAKKMSTIVLVAVRYFKEWVRKVLYPHLAART